MAVLRPFARAEDNPVDVLLVDSVREESAAAIEAAIVASQTHCERNKILYSVTNACIVVSCIEHVKP